MKRARALLPAALLATALAVVSGCSGSSMDEQTSSGPVKIGLIMPLTGPYKPLGDDSLKGWELYLEQHGGKLGGHDIQVTMGDEADGGAIARASIEKLLKQDGAVAIAGTMNGTSVGTIVPVVTAAKVPLVGMGGRPTTLDDISYTWHASWNSTETGAAIADYVRTTVDGPVFVIGPDYQGGYDQIGGFTSLFTQGGGVIANEGGEPAWTPWPGTTNFGPWLSTIARTKAKAVYAFYAGADAVAFVKQYKEFGLHEKLPLYGAGFLTEGGVLKAEGAAAEGVYTVMNYAHDLDNATNRAFAAAYTQKHGSPPNLFSLTGFDAAAVLDRAIADAGPNPTGESINAAIGRLGRIDSPRGAWQFGPRNHTPIQKYYLRQVRTDGRGLSNVLVQDLATMGS